MSLLKQLLRHKILGIVARLCSLLLSVECVCLTFKSENKEATLYVLFMLCISIFFHLATMLTLLCLLAALA